MRSQAELSAFAAAIIRDAGLFDYWLVRHPRRLSSLLGFCDRGEDLLAEIAQALQPDDRRSEMANGDRKNPRGGEKAPPRKPPDPPKPPETDRESPFDILSDMGGAAIDGALRGTPAGGAVMGAISKIPWDKIINAIIEGANAKKDKTFLKSFVGVLLSIDRLKDLLLKLIDDTPITDPAEKSLLDTVYQGISNWLGGNGDATLAAARKKKAHDELRPRIVQLEEVAHRVGRAIDADDFDSAREQAKSLKPLLEGVRDWIRDNMK